MRIFELLNPNQIVPQGPSSTNMSPSTTSATVPITPPSMAAQPSQSPQQPEQQMASSNAPPLMPNTMMNDLQSGHSKADAIANGPYGSQSPVGLDNFFQGRTTGENIPLQ